MNSHLRSTIADRLNRARLALNNTQKDATLSALVGSYGYTAEKLDEGWQLYNAANAAVNTQAAALGTRRQATADAAAAGMVPMTDATKTYFRQADTVLR